MTQPRLILDLRCLLLMFLLNSGCAPDPVQRFVPTPTDARQAVETALSNWKSGTKHGTISSPSLKVKIDVYDARWHDEKKKLESYRIVKEITGKPLPQFEIQLKFPGKPEETTIYLVNGIDPLQVYRESDYNKAYGVETKGIK